MSPAEDKLAAAAGQSTTRAEPGVPASPWQRLWLAAKGGGWALHIVYLGAAWVITKVYWHMTLQLDVATIDMMVDGTAEAPFAHRILMPWVLRTLCRVNEVGDPVLADLGVRIFILYGLMVLLRRWMRHFVAPALADLSPLLLGIILPGTFDWYWPYDFAGFFFWTACLLALLERRHWVYLLCFTVGSLNRETTALLIGIFAVTQWEALGRRRTLLWAAGQGVVFAAIALSIRLLVHPHGGEFVEVHLLENLWFMAGQNGLGLFENWMTMLSAFGFLWILAPWRWHRKSFFLRRACWLLPVAAVANLVLGRLAEPRLWNEWLPIVMALAAQTVAQFVTEEQLAPRVELRHAPSEHEAR